MERLVQLFRDRFGSAPAEMSLLPLSGSARKYYRMDGCGMAVIGCIGTNPAENRAFLAVDAAMRRGGVNAPEVYGVSPDGMAYIQEDLGDGQLFELLKDSVRTGDFTPDQKEWLKRTMEALPSVQFRTAESLDWNVCFPDKAFNARMVSFDLNYFKYDFLKFAMPGFDEIRLQDDFDALTADSLKDFPDAFMYRDFQARNVMIRDGQPWFIDFQGGRRGPYQYDPASFIWNAGTHFSAGMRSFLEKCYVDALGEYVTVDEEQWHESFRLISLVRLLQETGAYGYRGMVERKQLFIDCIPPLLECLGALVEEPFARYPYLTEVLRYLSSGWDGSTNMPGFKVAL